MTLPHEKQLEDTLKAIHHLKKQSENSPLFKREISRLEDKLHHLKEEVYNNLNPWERIAICRHPKRPRTSNYIKNIVTSFTELSGDRRYADDKAILGGLGKIGDMKCVVLGHEKGHDTETRLHHNFGMPHPEGYRKALRLMQLAEKFNLPLVSFIDTSGAFPGLEAEERGQGGAIAENIKAMSRLRTPIIIVIIGEGASGGALGIGVGDVILMLEHAYYSVITPEGCASILWKDPSKNVHASSALKLNSEDLLELQVIDKIIEEPLGGAHHSPEMIFENVKEHILEQWNILKGIPTELLVEKRYHKFRKMGDLWHGQESSTPLQEIDR
jgi:acetyl-CoA carboxylase carboxyl transferase subunit alpha